MKKILFISPYSGRAGAEMYLYRFLKNFDTKQFQVMLVTEKHSPLFASLQPKIQYTSMEKHPLRKAIARIKEKLYKYEKNSSFGIFLEHIHRQFQPDEWVLNTIIMQKVIASAMRVGTKITTIIHEMPSAYSFISANGMQSIIDNSHRIISNSKASCAAISTMGREDVLQQPCFFDPVEIELTVPRTQLRNSLGIEDNDFVLVGSGTQDHNKGLELFMQISESAKDKQLKFVWIGAECHSGFNYYLNKYQEKLRKNSNLIITGERTNDYYDYLNIGDLFLLTSFNESFSLVTIEAMALGKPVISYDCGGVRDLISENTGRILNTRNCNDWLNAITWIKENTHAIICSELKNASNNYTTAKQVPNLEKTLSNSPT